jgi:hypothetical protein
MRSLERGDLAEPGELHLVVFPGRPLGTRHDASNVWIFSFGMVRFIWTPGLLEPASRFLLLLFLPRSFARTLVLCGSRFLHGPSSVRPLLGPLHDRTRSQGRERDRGSSVGSQLANNNSTAELATQYNPSVVIAPHTRGLTGGRKFMPPARVARSARMMPPISSKAPQ